MDITRKEFFGTLAAGAATAYLTNSAAAPANAAPAGSSKMKLGITAYSYTYDLRARAMTLEDVVADVADMGGEGVEILGEAHVPGYPNPPQKWVEQWFAWMEKYHTKPSAYDTFVDTMFYKDRLLTVDEAVERLVTDFKLANRLGFKVLRQQWPPYKADNPADQIWAPYCKSAMAMQVMQKALPFAEKYDVKMAVELHSPTQLKSEWIDDFLEVLNRTKTKHFGFCPDMSIFVERAPKSHLTELRREGARDNILDYINRAYEENLGAEKTVAEVVKMGGNEAEQKWGSMAGIYHFSKNDPKDMARLAPYIYHVHAKFYEMMDDLHEYSIPYETVIPVLAAGGYSGYLSSEYEGAREDFQTSAQIRLQQVMLKRLLAAV